jgi:hypothetical protein
MNVKYILISFALVLICNIVFPQKTVTSSGTAQLELTEDKSRMELKNELREKAIIDALERAFGRVIIQGNATYITNLQTGQEVKTNTVFNTIANTSVMGEVESVTDEKFTDVEGVKTVEGKQQKVIEVRCDIEIKAHKTEAASVTFTSFPLACTDEKCKTSKFANKDNLYLYFSSPENGYLSVYLDETTQTQCLYPFSSMPSEFDGGVPVEADRKYILFSKNPDFDYFRGNVMTDSYELYSKSIQDMNRIFIIFSKNPMNKPFLNNVSEKLLDSKDYIQGYRLPKSLPSEDFQRWLNNYRSIGKNSVQVLITDITITK